MNLSPQSRGLDITAVGIFVTLLTFLGAASALAAGNSEAKLMLHALSITTKNPCTRVANLPATCTGYQVGNLPLYPPTLFVYALVVNGSRTEGMAGASFGINYDGALLSGVDIYGWYLCADSDLPTPGWPATGTGNTISFTPARCQTGGNTAVGGVATLGYFYCGAYTSDMMRVTTHPETNGASVTSCAGAIDYVLDSDASCTHLGALGFGTRTGINPCGRENIHGGCSFSCSITGPTEVASGQAGIAFTARQGRGQITWSIAGDATFEGPTADHTTVYVRAGAPGQFTVQAHFGSECARTVTVTDAVTAVPTSWGRIKSLTMGR
jgi:hypothetical protein